MTVEERLHPVVEELSEDEAETMLPRLESLSSMRGGARISVRWDGAGSIQRAQVRGARVSCAVARLRQCEAMLLAGAAEHGLT